ncbi:MAG: LytTR family DNA-binding domain-containing protein [Bacteroidales bacterium]|nr:LytTR family DNA-binding domain-containing protein [Bacteroidales bacterium]
MKIIIIDDEVRARKSIADLLKLSSLDIDIVAEADGVKTGIEAIKKYKPDLILLDIDMPDGTGFDLLKAMDYINFKIIFITAYEEFAVKAFEFSAIDYILKPADPKKLLEAISKAQQIVEQENINLKLNALFANLDNVNPDSKKLVLKTAEKIYLISTRDIIRCESDMGYTQFFLADGKNVLVSKNLKDYEVLLDGLGFFRIHQSHLINLKYIDYYDKTEGGSVKMKDKSMLPLSRRKKESFLKLIEMM